MNVRLSLTAVALGALLLTACKETPSDVAFGKRVQSYLMSHPEVVRDAFLELERKEASEKFSRHRKALERDPRDFVLHPDGKVTVVQFLDFNCGYCKVAAPQVLDLVARNPDVRFVFKELPVIGGPASERAARLALAVHKGGGDYLGLYRDFIAAHPLDDAAIDRVLVARGLDVAKLETQAIQAGFPRYIEETKQLSQELEINGTPSFVVGDTLIVGGDIPGLQKAIAKARKA